MDNLLPAVTAVDVTSSQFRETSLPYQQWEATRTHCAPSTPSDIAHLLPPIGDRTSARRADLLQPLHPGLPRPDPPLPRPAPVDRNISDLYDPALDPSPIGMEQRGVVQPVRITRIVPRQNLGTPESRCGTSKTRQRGPGRCTTNTTTTISSSSGNTAVTILNGYTKKTPTTLLWRDGGSDGGDDDDEREENKVGSGCTTIDVFVPRLGGKAGIDHVALLPSELFRRVLQTVPSPSPAAEDEAAPLLLREEGLRSLGDKESSRGLTIFLAESEDWLKRVDSNFQRRTLDVPAEHGDAGGGDPSTNGDLPWRQENGTSESAINNNLQRVEFTEDKVARLLFRREDDGTPALPHSAFRVQFEPGPLGMELEEDAGGRGVVQVRRVLQAGQAEQDGRLFAGFLVVAVGDWGDDFSAATDAIAAATATMDDVDPAMVGGEFMSAVSTAVGGGSKQGNAATTRRPAVLRSLGELEEAVLRRDPNKLFVLWALDRMAPEAVAALGAPESVPGDGRRFFRRWSPPSVFTEEERLHRSGYSRGGKPGESIDAGYNHHCTSNDNEASGSGGVGAVPSKTRTGHGSNQWVESTGVSEGGAPGWESKYGEYATNVTGKRRDKECESFFGGEPSIGYSHPPLMQGFPPPRDPSEVEAATCLPNSTSRTTRECFNSGGAGGGARGWDFETGGGFFDNNDQGLAARKQPLRQHDGDDAEEAVKDRPLLPLGLAASAVDELSVFIWFSNNHESAVMQVSWIDYDGKIVPRRSLAPGACYFERSFATHPWVIQQEGQTTAEEEVDNNDDEVAAPAATADDDDGDWMDLGQNPEQKQKNGAPPFPTSMTGRRRRGGGGGEGGEGRDCCVLRLGDAMAVARLTGSLIWNPSGRTLSVTKQAKVGVTGISASSLAAVGSGATEGAGVAPGKKQMCMVGGERKAEAARAREERASVRREKARILEEMRTWRRYPPGSVGVGSEHGEALGGLGQGAPNLRVVMIGSSRWHHRWADR